MPDLGGAVEWLNSAPLSRKLLHGKVVLINFWTYSCINSLRELPYMKAWPEVQERRPDGDRCPFATISEKLEPVRRPAQLMEWLFDGEGCGRRIGERAGDTGESDGVNTGLGGLGEDHARYGVSSAVHANCLRQVRTFCARWAAGAA